MFGSTAYERQRTQRRKEGHGRRERLPCDRLRRGDDNPKTLRLSDWQKRRSVEFEFHNKSHFEIEAHMTDGPGKGGNFVFSGAADVLARCDTENLGLAMSPIAKANPVRL